MAEQRASVGFTKMTKTDVLIGKPARISTWPITNPTMIGQLLNPGLHEDGPANDGRSNGTAWYTLATKNRAEKQYMLSGTSVWISHVNFVFIQKVAIACKLEGKHQMF